MKDLNPVATKILNPTQDRTTAVSWKKEDMYQWEKVHASTSAAHGTVLSQGRALYPHQT